MREYARCGTCIKVRGQPRYQFSQLRCLRQTLLFIPVPEPDWLCCQLPEIIWLYIPALHRSTQLQRQVWLYSHPGDSNPELHTCMASTLLPDPSSKPPTSWLILVLFIWILFFSLVCFWGSYFSLLHVWVYCGFLKLIWYKYTTMITGVRI